MNLTHDMETVAFVLYDKYIERTDSGETKHDAREFQSNFYLSTRKLWDEYDIDIDDILNGLKQKGLIKKYVTGRIELTNELIAFAEENNDRKPEIVLEIASKLSSIFSVFI